MEYYAHLVPGRLRVRLPEIRRDKNKADEVTRLLDVYGVDRIKVNPVTGSVVITYDPSLTEGEDLLSLLIENGWYDSNRAISCDQKLERATQKAASKIGRSIFGYAVGKALESNGLSLLAALI